MSSGGSGEKCDLAKQRASVRVGLLEGHVVGGSCVFVFVYIYMYLYT